MKTFSEERGHTNFNWFKELGEDKERSEDNWYDLCSRSSSWITCACGNQCYIIPRDWYSGEPKDEYLRWLGRIFHTFIRMRDITGALFILYAIEDRSADLIKKIRKNKQH